MGATSIKAAIEALVEELERHADDAGTYLVLADVLVEAGDPRGELIHIQHAVSRERALEAQRLAERRRARGRHGRRVGAAAVRARPGDDHVGATSRAPRSTTGGSSRPAACVRLAR